MNTSEREKERDDAMHTANAPHVPARAPQVEQFVDQFLTAVCDTSRRHILECLSPAGNGDVTFSERSVGEIAEHLGLAASTISEHLKQLSAMHLLASRKEGKKIYYRLRNLELVDTFWGLLHSLEAHYQRNILPPAVEE